MRAGIVALLLAAAACDPGPLRVVNESAEAWTHAPGFEDEVRAAVEDAARAWGRDASILDGWKLVIVDGLVGCGDDAAHTGCTDPGDRKISVSTYFALPEDRGGGCVEVLPIWHEVGHVALALTRRWDPDHADPRWADEPLPFCTAWLEPATPP